MKNKPAFMIAAPKSGSGKTIITLALLSALKKKGMDPVSFKCGPDYIDPMFHKKVLSIPSRNLDIFLMGEENVKRSFFGRETRDNEIALIEGVMGLYDGLGGVDTYASTYHVAELLGIPIVLVLDGKGSGRTIISVIKGILSDDKEKLIRGIILNRVGASMYERLKPLIEEECKIEAMGYVPESPEFYIESRHLGLYTADEIKDMDALIDEAGEMVSETVSIGRLCEIATECAYNDHEISTIDAPGFKRFDDKRIAVARDEAFCFIYEDNIDFLKTRGADILYFSPIHDKELPGNLDGVVIFGGYPELYAEKLSENVSMRESIKEAFKRGIPFYAECGGFMYLQDRLISLDGKEFDMCGCIRGISKYKGKLVRFGYGYMNYSDHRFPIHEFHYYDSDNNGDSALIEKTMGSRKYQSTIIDDRHYLGFPHLFFNSADRFIEGLFGF